MLKGAPASCSWLRKKWKSWSDKTGTSEFVNKLANGTSAAEEPSCLLTLHASEFEPRVMNNTFLGCILYHPLSKQNSQGKKEKKKKKLERFAFGSAVTRGSCDRQISEVTQRIKRKRENQGVTDRQANIYWTVTRPSWSQIRYLMCSCCL